MTGPRASKLTRFATGVSTGAMAALFYLLFFQRTGTSLLVWISLLLLWVGPVWLILVGERKS